MHKQNKNLSIRYQDNLSIPITQTDVTTSDLRSFVFFNLKTVTKEFNKTSASSRWREFNFLHLNVYLCHILAEERDDHSSSEQSYAILSYIWFGFPYKSFYFTLIWALAISTPTGSPAIETWNKSKIEFHEQHCSP